MRVNKRIILSAISVLILSGCASAAEESDQKETTIVQPQSASPSSDETPDPQQSTSDNVEAEVQWDLYPGLKTKLDQLVTEKNCDLIKELQSENSNDDENLKKYFENSLQSAGCQ
jgi:hypothetical protein